MAAVQLRVLAAVVQPSQPLAMKAAPRFYLWRLTRSMTRPVQPVLAPLADWSSLHLASDCLPTAILSPKSPTEPSALLLFRIPTQTLRDRSSTSRLKLSSMAPANSRSRLDALLS